jgi:hypothetical protein
MTMTDEQQKVVDDLSPEDHDALVAVLKGWEEEGQLSPKLPLGYDVDQDGAIDAWALDEEGNLILTNVETIGETVFVSDGDGIEQGGNAGLAEETD